MKVLLQRVTSASVTVEGRIVGCIDAGLLLLVGFGHADTEHLLEPMARRIANMRVFADDVGRFSYSLLDTGGAALLVPQFTLYAQTRKGRRPDFSAAMRPDSAERLFDSFVNAVHGAGVSEVRTGRFGAEMRVSLVNDGPVTLLVQSE
jgi:D-tyrosyl-tRNA(Tyr) deacylase